MLGPSRALKAAPVISTWVPKGPEDGVILWTLGGTMASKDSLFDAPAGVFTDTLTAPLIPPGTLTTMRSLAQLSYSAASTGPKLTYEEPRLGPNPLP